MSLFMKIGIINYGNGNIYSISNALRELDVNHGVINSPSGLDLFDGIILPGVGNFANSKSLLDGNHWTEEIKNFTQNANKAVLGICLGMQLLADTSTEGSSTIEVSGLGLIPGKVDHLKTFGCKERTPHVGWNSINITQKNSLFNGINDDSDFYFVHSYAFNPLESKSIIATTHYDVEFPVAVVKNKIWGVQFHPEKSSKVGFTLLKNFINSI